MNNNQLLAVLLIIFGLISCYMGVEKNQPTGAETGIKIIIDLLKQLPLIGGSIEYVPPKRGTFLIVIGVLLAITGGAIIIGEARKRKIGIEKALVGAPAFFKQDQE